MKQTHRATILLKPGGPLLIEERATPEPGPKEILIQVKAVALNPVDYAQRERGLFPVSVFPAILGSDVAGFIAKLGSEVTTDLAPGTRVTALAGPFFQQGSRDHGGFQEYTIAQAEAVAVLPREISFEQGCVFGVGILAAWTGWTTLGLPITTERHFKPQDKQATLIWGGSSSVGTLAIQSARSLGFTIYTTASSQHHEYLKTLGAHATFDYKDADVVSQIVEAVKRDGVKLLHVHCVIDAGLQPSLDVLKETKGQDVAKLAYAPILPQAYPTLDGVEIIQNFPPMDHAVLDPHLNKIYCTWLQEALKSGDIVSSPHIQIEGGGLEGLDAALDKLEKGVSGTKVVVPI